MQWNRMITVVGAHAEGEVGRVVTGGIIDVPGETTFEKMEYLQAHDGLRRFLNHEPRGCAQQTTNLLLPPTAEGSHAAFIPLQADATHPMSGSNAMCVATVLLETGIVPMQEPETTVVLDTAAGQVTAKAECRGGKVSRVTLDFFPAYAAHIDAPVEVEGLGTLNVDIAFGGVYYVLPKARDLGFRIGPDVADDMVRLGNRIKAAAREQYAVAHPENPRLNSIGFLMFTDTDDMQPDTFRNATIMPPGRIDRSPCGTGSAARLAALYARGEAQVGQTYQMRSTIDSRFETSIQAVTMVGDHPAILPVISGRAWIYATMQLGCDPTDPFPEGYTLGDTWGDGIKHVIPNLS